MRGAGRSGAKGEEASHVPQLIVAEYVRSKKDWTIEIILRTPTTLTTSMGELGIRGG